jgi:hypothetical protein
VGHIRALLTVDRDDDWGLLLFSIDWKVQRRHSNMKIERVLTGIVTYLYTSRRSAAWLLRCPSPPHVGRNAKVSIHWQIEYMRAVIVDTGRSNSKTLPPRTSWSGRKSLVLAVDEAWRRYAGSSQEGLDAGGLARTSAPARRYPRKQTLTHEPLAKRSRCPVPCSNNSVKADLNAKMRYCWRMATQLERIWMP